MFPKALRITYSKIHGFIKVYGEISYLVLFDDCCDKICNRIQYLVREKSVIKDSINHNFSRTKNYLPVGRNIDFS